MDIEIIKAIVGGIVTLSLVLILGYLVFPSMVDDKKEKNKPTTHWTDQLVSCEECKCLLNKLYAAEIDVACYKDTFIPSSRKEYYCAKCKPNYTSRMDGRYFKELEVTEKGEPVGYKKDK